MQISEVNTAGYEHGIDRSSAIIFSEKNGADVHDLFALANRIRERYRGGEVDLCSIINAKSGACPEDCSYCAQSTHSRTETDVYPLMDRKKILEGAARSKEYGVTRFCVVTSGKKPSPRELDEICGFVSELRAMDLLPCATLGLLNSEEMRKLKEAGLNRYHHNLETSESFFSEICTTHTYQDKLKTIAAVKEEGLSICSGGIFGLGESWEDRIDMALALREIGVDSVPINFFTPVKGTPLGDKELLDPFEALKIIAIYRLILPKSEIRVCGGRSLTLRDMNSFIFNAGADGLLLGNYLTTNGRRPEDDLQLIKDMGLVIKR